MTLVMSDYQILGCTASDSDEVIKKKYRRLILQHHPDKSSDDSSETFQKIHAAYQRIVQRSPVQRFEERKAQQKEDELDQHAIKIEISFHESFFGCSRNVEIDNQTVSFYLPRGVFDGYVIPIPNDVERYLLIHVLESENSNVHRENQQLIFNIDTNIFSYLAQDSLIIDWLDGSKMSVHTGNCSDRLRHIDNIELHHAVANFVVTGLGFRAPDAPSRGNLVLRLHLSTSPPIDNLQDLAERNRRASLRCTYRVRSQRTQPLQTDHQELDAGTCVLQ